MQELQKHIVVLGAGVAGIRFILDFQPKIKNLCGVNITIIDQNDYHQYLYKLHEVAGGRSTPKDIIVPIEWLLRKKRAEFIQTSVESIDIKKKIVKTNNLIIPYDILVVALGSQTCYYEIEGLEENSMGLKSVKEAHQIQKRVKEIFTLKKGRENPLTFIIGGGGFTGVELAGEFAEWLPQLADEYGINRESIRIIIVEALDSILAGWDPKVTEGAVEILRSKGVELMLNQMIVKADDKGIILKNGDRIDADLFVWTGGVEGVSICPAFELGKSKRVLINNICAAINAPDVYHIGDCAYVCDASTNEPLEPNAHIAMIQASFLAKNLYAKLVGKHQKDFIPKQVGEVVSIGTEHAVGRLYGISLRGWMAKIAKLMIHLFYVYSIGGIKLLVKDRSIKRYWDIRRFFDRVD
ncbi:MAG: NAD(P)/FAD-dependent oxidoreductase [Candidatus Bathyarchaeota archaeon]|nr:NAD(P)/FAD-dependent oxidoreductase [Candidatus Bathyarchaeota archaeon]